ncbi:MULTISPECIES: hypothetical protein [Halobacterium]|uniref:hypothetical protein n=1 Tax=Halobacterium TaxID=2239 RepID=UPI000A9FCDB1|nr:MULTISPECIES: hypothetical protein [Halobacterium]MCG1002089.1 hypothetical protein [Halobacterium noricense]
MVVRVRRLAGFLMALLVLVFDLLRELFLPVLLVGFPAFLDGLLGFRLVGVDLLVGDRFGVRLKR